MILPRRNVTSVSVTFYCHEGAAASQRDQGTPRFPSYLPERVAPVQFWLGRPDVLYEILVVYKPFLSPIHRDEALILSRHLDYLLHSLHVSFCEN